MNNKKQQKPNTIMPVIFATVSGSSAVTAGTFFSMEPNMVNISAGVLTTIVSIASAYETIKLVKEQNNYIKKLEQNQR